MPFEFSSTEVPEVIHIKPRIFKDDRGFFAETFKGSDFSYYGMTAVKQVNHSQSTKGVLRGLHYQLNPKAQGKLVT
ncbi:MAG: dTDP-4-dehydrorhamnose 3,5-epimerase family protein, partial [Pirellulales bacterium]|nr:dTDP-4-dehydrorhamnose 3,5-epimerase family protein [Pirellulales bacterium]